MSTNPLLSFEWVKGTGVSSVTVVMLHGILGQKRNLFGFARRFVKTFGEFQVLLVDLRNHGASRGFSGPHTLEACAQDLSLLFEALRVAPKSIIGHSFGAGVTLTYAKRHAHELESIWLLDALPSENEQKKKLDPQIDQVLKALEHCLPAESKSFFEACLQRKGVTQGLSAWLSMNLYERDGSLDFAPEPTIAREMLEDYMKYYVVSDLNIVSRRCPIFVVQAESSANSPGKSSSRNPPPDLAEAKSPSPAAQERVLKQDPTGTIKFLSLPKSGHWVHVDNPEGLLEMMAADFA